MDITQINLTDLMKQVSPDCRDLVERIQKEVPEDNPGKETLIATAISSGISKKDNLLTAIRAGFESFVNPANCGARLFGSSMYRYYERVAPYSAAISALDTYLA